MLTVSEETKQAYQNGGRKNVIINFYPIGKYRIHPGTNLYPDATLLPGSKGSPEFSLQKKQILSETMVISEGLFEGENIDFRSCFASKCTITVLNVDTDVYGYDMEVIQEIEGVKVPLFTGTIDEAKERGRETRIVAYDYLYYNYDEDMSEWYNSLTFPMTAKDFRMALYDVCNIPYAEVELVNDDMILQKSELSGKVTGRELLAMIGEFNGAFVHVNRRNELTYIMLQNISYIYPGEIYPGEAYPGIQTGIGEVEKIKSYLSCEHEQYRTRDIDKVILDGSLALESGIGSNAYKVEDNLLFESLAEEDRQTALDNLYLIIKGLPYVPHQTEIRGRPYVEVGDVINIKTKKTAFDTYVFRRTLKGCQALRDTYSAEGEEYHNAAYRI